MYDEDEYYDDCCDEFDGEDWEEETWDAMTDGQYGDYPGGCIDYDALGFWRIDMAMEGELKRRLEEYLGHEVSSQFYLDCLEAALRAKPGPAGLGSYAVMGYFVPFEKVLGHEYKDHSCWPCREAMALGNFFRKPDILTLLQETI